MQEELCGYASVILMTCVTPNLVPTLDFVAHKRGLFQIPVQSIEK